jgi:putative ABC transport system permease protein
MEGLSMVGVDEVNYAFQNLVHRKMRSMLSALSILIGITAVFALISFGSGLQKYVDDIAKQSGTDKLFIQAKSMGAPGTDEAFYLTQDDVEFVEKINGVKEISGMYMKPAEIISRDKRRYNYLSGIDIAKKEFILESMTIKVHKGRDLKKGELGKAVLGYNYQFDNKIFPRGVKTGDKVSIDGQELEVVGFYSLVGNPSDDANIYVTKEQFEVMNPDKKDKYSFVMVRSEPDISPKELSEKIKEKLRKHKGQEEGKEDFYVQTFEDAIEMFTNILDVINAILVLIALISVVVASVNIMNTMYTAVLERTKEIGVMKAVGARNSDIIFIFIMESGVIGVVGGVLGVALGYLVASTGGAIAAGAGYAMLKPSFSWMLITGCIVFSFLVGAGSGVMPAIRASKLHPVDALRYE